MSRLSGGLKATAAQKSSPRCFNAPALGWQAPAVCSPEAPVARPTATARPLGFPSTSRTTSQSIQVEGALILGCALTTLDPVPICEALADLVTEIAESARVIGMLLRPAG